MGAKETFARMDEETGEWVGSDQITNLVGDGLEIHCRVSHRITLEGSSRLSCLVRCRTVMTMEVRHRIRS